MVLLATPFLSAGWKIRLNEFDFSLSNYRFKHVPSVLRRLSICYTMLCQLA